MSDEITPSAERTGPDAPGTPEATVFCSLEGANFPGAEFTSDPQWGLVHQTTHPHTTMGFFIDTEPKPTPNAPDFI
ncbi:MAG: hypothetical protein JO027_12585 [Solirubrobacterales bacterium]|nr:hypothetical protein [Solirubrobacterales bacterium]